MLVPRVPVLVCILAYIAGYSHGNMNAAKPQPCLCNVISPDFSQPTIIPASEIPRTSFFDKIKQTFCQPDPDKSPIRVMDDDKERGYIDALERNDEPREFLPGHTTDSYTYFHRYMHLFGKESPQSPLWKFRTFPLLHTWPNFFEAYHNHWQRYRGKDVLFMEIGVQSGGKIAMLRDYFGPGFKYVGIDINPSTTMFETADFVSIEIGDSEKRTFLEKIKKKYPKVDVFLDDGAHTMSAQRTAMEIMWPHVKDDGVYVCEDLNTSWNAQGGYKGKRMSDERDEYFRENTMMGLVHRTIDWLHYSWVAGRTGSPDPPERLNEGFWPERWWKQFAISCKHIHIYNQIVVYEKGQSEIFSTRTIGYQLPVSTSGDHEKIDWKDISSKVAAYTGSEWGF